MGLRLRQGHGRVLPDFIDNCAQHPRILTLCMNAAPEAVGYYEKLGWGPEIWDKAELGRHCRGVPSNELTSLAA